MKFKVGDRVIVCGNPMTMSESDVFYLGRRGIVLHPAGMRSKIQLIGGGETWIWSVNLMVEESGLDVMLELIE